MSAWLLLILFSAIGGAIPALVTRSILAVFLGAAIPWFGLLAVLLYYEYFVPYQGGGASMWPVAQLFGGTVAAGVGASSALMVRFFRSRL